MLASLRSALRVLLRRPEFSLSVCLLPAIGIGLSAALIGVVQTVVWAEPPFEQPERLFHIWEVNDEFGGTRHGAAPGNVPDWQRSARSVEKVAAMWLWKWITLLDSHAGETAQVRAVSVTADFFTVLGVEPVAGRIFSADEVAREQRVVLISYQFWQRHFGGSADVIEKSIPCRDGSRRVIGVMPASFHAPGMAPGDVQIFEPWDFQHRFGRLPSIPRDWRFARAIAQLRQGVSPAEAKAELNGIAQRLGQMHPVTNYGWGVDLTPLGVSGNVEKNAVANVLLGASGLLLLLACVSASSFLLLRSFERERELSVRTALGESLGSRTSGILFEVGLLAAAAGVAGVVLAEACVTLLNRLEPGSLAGVDHASLSQHVMVVALLVTASTYGIAALTPIVHGTMYRGWHTLDGRGTSVGRRFRRLTKWIVVAQVAMASTLLVGSAHVLESFKRIIDVDPGFEFENLLVMRMRLDRDYLGRADEYFGRLIEELEALPGVEDAGAATALPMDELDVDFERPYWRAGETRPPGGGPGVKVRVATVGYFETMGIPLVQGRTIREYDDRSKPRVLLVNESMARRTWPGENPVGKFLRLDYQGYTEPYEIVGVVGDTHPHGRKSEPETSVYVPHKQSPYLMMNVVVRSEASLSSVVPAVRRVVMQLDEDQPPRSIESMDALVRGWERWDRLAATVMSLFAVVGLSLATFGTYTVTRYLILQRRQEIGIRLVVGASRRHIVAQTLREGLSLSLLGVAVGFVGTYLLNGVLVSILFDVLPMSPGILAAASVPVVGAVLGASYWSLPRMADMAPRMLLTND